MSWFELEGGNKMSWFELDKITDADIVRVLKDIIVSCDTCKYLVFKSDAQEKEYYNYSYQKLYFCKNHKVNWSKKIVVAVSTQGGMLTGESHISYTLVNVPCDENGKILEDLK